MTLSIRTLAIAASLAFSSPAFAEFACKEGDAAAFEAEMDRAIGAAHADYKAGEAQQQQAITREMDAMVAAGTMTDQARAGFFADTLDAPEFKDMERIKRETLLPKYMRALQGIFMTGSASDCALARETLSTLEEINAINLRQYEWMRARLNTMRAGNTR